MALTLKKVAYKKILKDIDCEFEEGKIYAILSSNEIEKDCLSKIITGKINDYQGEIISSYSKNKISYMSNNQNIFVCDTVYDELKLPISNYQEETINKKIDFIFKILKINDHIKYLNPNEISGGEKILLKVGIALVTNPKVLVINELPELDDYHKKILIKLFKKIVKEYHKTLIILTSDILFSYEVCDKYILLKNGKIISNSNKKDLLKETDKLEGSSLQVPKIIDFINTARKKKNISLDITYDIKELMKDIYRNVK